MITQYEVPYLIKEQLPKLADDNYPVRITMNIYKSVQYFSDFTRHAVQDHHFNIARKCFSLAEKLYQQGDEVVKNTIENVFIFSFTSFMPASRIEKVMLQSLIPLSLYALYVKQVSTSGC